MDPDGGMEGQPACDLRAVGKKFDKGLYTSLVSTEQYFIYHDFIQFVNVIYSFNYKKIL